MRAHPGLGAARRYPKRLVTVAIVAMTLLGASSASALTEVRALSMPVKGVQVVQAAAAVPAWVGWASGPDAGRKLAPLAEVPAAVAPTRSIVVDPTSPLPRPWLGTGATLTDASVQLLAGRPEALARLYSPTDPAGAHLNLLRLPLTATDLGPGDWSFNWSGGQLAAPFPAEALSAVRSVAAVKALRSDLSVLATPWSAPAAMKTSKSLRGGAFLSALTTPYANMLNAQAGWLLTRGVPLKYMTMVNEPFNSKTTYPTMTMTDDQMVKVAKVLGPKLRARGVQLWALDHNWEHRTHVAGLVSGAVDAGGAKQFSAVAFHCYGPTTPSWMSVVTQPGVNLPAVMTECTGNSKDSEAGSYHWDARNLVAAAVAAGSRGLMMWSLALDPAGGPKLAGTCTGGQGECRGLLKIDPVGGAVTPQAEFYTLAHLSRAADPLAKVLPTSSSADVAAASFSNPDGTLGVFGHNGSGAAQTVSVRVIGGAERRFTVQPGELFTVRGTAGTPDATYPGRVIVSPDGFRYYVDTTGFRHFIATDAVFTCYGGWPRASANVPWSAINTIPETEHAACPTFRAGDVIKHPDGDSYVLDTDPGGKLRRHWIPTATDFVCARAEANRAVVTVTRYMVAELASGADRPGGNCIVRGPGGDAHYINDQGLREWIPDSPTWDCEVGRGIRALNVPDGFVASVTETGWHYCLNKANLVNKVLRHADGDAYFIHPDNTKTWIPDGATFGCRSRSGVPVVETRWRQYVDAFPGAEWDYCYDINTLKGRIISHPDGDSHYVDTDGVRHWIPSVAVYNCLRGRGIPADTVRWRDYITRTPEREWAVCGDTLSTNQKLDRGQWLQSSDGRYRLIMQGDGNLVLYNAANRAIWATNRSGMYAIVQSDGNFVEYPATGPAVWASNTVGSGANRLVVQSDGNLVLYSPVRAVWASNTVGQ